MSFAHVIAYFSWPLMTLGVACFFVLRWRKVHGLRPSNLIGLVAVISLIAPLILILAYAHATAVNLFVEDMTFILTGVTLSFLFPFFKQTSSARGAAIIGALMVLLGTYNISGDFIRDRGQASGMVTRKYVTHSYRGPLNYYIEIAGHGFPTTLDLYQRIDTASRVKVLIGRASGTIFDVNNL